MLSKTLQDGLNDYQIGDKIRTLRQKSSASLYFDSTVPHAYRRSGGRTCSAVVVTSA